MLVTFHIVIAVDIFPLILTSLVTVAYLTNRKLESNNTEAQSRVQKMT